MEWGADLLMPLPVTVSCFSKIQIGFTFLVPAHPGNPRKRAIKRVCLCVLYDILCQRLRHYVVDVNYCLTTRRYFRAIPHYGMQQTTDFQATLWHSDTQLVEFLIGHTILFSFDERCPRCCDGHPHLVNDASAGDGQIWHCISKHYNYKIPFCAHSFFSYSKLSLSTVTVTEIIYSWVHRYTQHIAINETCVSQHTIIDFYNFLR